MLLKCGHCKQYMEEENFFLDSTRSTGRHGFCKACVSKRYYQKNYPNDWELRFEKRLKSQKKLFDKAQERVNRVGVLQAYERSNEKRKGTQDS